MLHDERENSKKYNDFFWEIIWFKKMKKKIEIKLPKYSLIYYV